MDNTTRKVVIAAAVVVGSIILYNVFIGGKRSTSQRPSSSVPQPATPVTQQTAPATQETQLAAAPKTQQTQVSIPFEAAPETEATQRPTQHDRPVIVYTHTDEAPALATYSFFHILQAFADSCDINIRLADISLAGRVLAAMGDYLEPSQRVPDALAELGQLVKRPEANVIKLPNISASVPQLKECIKELQAHGYQLPAYPDVASTDEEKAILKKYKSALGSIVNPVLRMGNSDRRAPPAVKEYARKNPHRMGPWAKDSKTHVATMSGGDFRHNEQSTTFQEATTVRIEQLKADGSIHVLLPTLNIQAGEILDATFMSKKALEAFLDETIQEAKKQGVLWSLHLKATMMKISDPIIFGIAVRTFFKLVWAQHGDLLASLKVNANNGFGDLLGKINTLPDGQRKAIEATILAAYAANPEIAMVNSDKGITNLHVPSDVIIDASMPAMIRESGRMWDKTGVTRDTMAVIPDSSYAGVFSAVIDFCKANGAFNPATMGSSPNVGLMAEAAEEYGSHDKTFQVSGNGTIRIVDNTSNKIILESKVEDGDIWRACQVKDAPIKDWVKLAITRARVTRASAVFWLDRNRAHDAEIIKKLEKYLPEDQTGLDIRILDPVSACKFTCERIAKGEDCISVTGNVLRDYNTDLFPILEVGTSAKMLSIVPLMQGGRLFETGAGGSAPKHVQQFNQENHLRWDSLGEFLALAVSFQHVANVNFNRSADILGRTLDDATTRYLLENRSPSPKVGQIDNRGSQYYIARYWAQSLANQTESPALAKRFAPIAAALTSKETEIMAELNAVQGRPCDIGGYYQPDWEKATAAMRPSPIFNDIIAQI